MTVPPAVPFVDLATQHEPLRAEILEAVDRILQDGQFVMGGAVTAFEEMFARLCGARFAVGVNSGLDSLVIALRALDIGPGDEVIMPPNSFIATAAAAGLIGARPVFVDVCDDLNIDPARIEDALTPRTKAIVPVHLTGRPADMAPINAIAARHGLAVVEDAAQAVGARYDGGVAGALGTIGCFSLHPLKTLNACGDGGIVTTCDETLYRRMLALRNHGLVSRDQCTEWGYNSRLDTLQAAILGVKLPHLARWTEQRRAVARRYRDAFKGIAGLDVPTERTGVEAVYHTFVLQTDRRDYLKQHLADHGIGSAVHYPVPIHLQPAAGYLGYRAGDFPVAEGQARRMLSLPVHHSLSPDQVDHVIDTVKHWATHQ